MKLFKEEPEVIGETSIWVCITNSRLFTHKSFFKLLWLVITNYNNDSYFVR